MKITPDVSLTDHTSFRTGGRARFFVEVDSVEDLGAVIALARRQNLPFLILGGGTNVLFLDSEFAGYVIRPKILGIEFGVGADMGLVIAGAGERWDDLVAATVAKNLAGLENLSLIPGSVGAAPVQNIGAYGTEIKDVVEWVEVFDPTTVPAFGSAPALSAENPEMKNFVRKLSPADCRFGYRDSFFKSAEGRGLIITRVAFRLVPNGRSNISYKDLANFFAGRASIDLSNSEQSNQGWPTIAEVRDAVIKIRRQKLPDMDKLGTAGSFFKNPIISNEKFAELAEKFPGLPVFPVDEAHKKIPLAWILDKVCGLNGFREGEVGLFETQPLALVNYGGATAMEIKNFAEKIAGIVKNKTGLEIEWEVNLIS